MRFSLLLLAAAWCAALPAQAEKAPPAKSKAAPKTTPAAPAQPNAPAPGDKAADADQKSPTPAAPSTARTPVDVKADPKLALIAECWEAGYGKLFGGVFHDEKKRIVLTIAGEDFLYEDGRAKTAAERINDPDVEDMFVQTYSLTNPVEKVEKDFDPGRARVEDLFKALYGRTEDEVRKNLTTVEFCGNKVRFNAKCGAAQALAAVGKDLDALFERHPEWKDFTHDLGGTFQWRMIAGTKRLSNHSFGTAIDLNVKKSAYWRWAPASTLATFSRKDWPSDLVQAFEKHGFVWGGKWWHYDTMHFEYRPELIYHATKIAAEPPPAPGAAEKASPEPEPATEQKPAPPKPAARGADLLLPLQQEQAAR